jgi:hypothetical protein
MPQACKVCRHSKRSEIDRAILNGDASRLIAARYGASDSSVRRHKPHVASRIVQAHQAEVLSSADTLLHEVESLKRRADLLGSQAEEAKDVRTALVAVRELTRLAELQARLVGAMRDNPGSVANHPAWHRLRSELLFALQPFPEASGAVVSAIQRVLGATEGGDRHALNGGG